MMENNYIHQTLDTHEKRLNALESQVNAIDKNYEVQRVQLDMVIEMLKDNKTDIKEIKDTPNKRWETIVTASLTALVGFLAAMLTTV